MTSQLQPVVLCGGSGTRLWPLSREDFPKQFLSLNGNASLLDATLRRLGKLGSTDTPICVANISHCQLLGAALDRAAIARNIIFEPMQRNTAPAIAAAAAVAVAKNPGVVLVVMPADHVVEDDMRFAESIARAFAIAAQGWICVLGAEPTGPSPAFG